MSKLKLPTVYFTPLCLKFRGRIVGAVSRMNRAIYIAFGLLIVSSMLLMVLIAGIHNGPNAGIRPEQEVESQVVETIQVEPPVITVASQAIPKSATNVINKEESKDMVVISKSLKGSVQLDFGWQFYQVYNDWRYHTGVDISGPNGQSVEAINNGQVIDVFRDRHSGLTVVVKNNTYTVYYGSLSEVTVGKDSHVSPGQIVGIMGGCDGEPYNHVHLAIKQGERYIDPNLLINKE